MRAGVVLTALAAVLLGACMVDGKVLGVDIGSENIKVTIVQPGRVPISIVTNEMSRRKSPGAVAFHQGARMLGEEAVGLEGRFPEKVFKGMRDMLGMSAVPAAAQAALDRFRLPSTLVPPSEAQLTLGLKAPDSDEVYSVDELMAMVLHYVHVIGEAYGEGTIKDAVLTVPAFFGQAQREALVAAAELGGLNVLGLVSEHACAALQWGIDKDFVNDTKTVIMYDMGAGSVTATLVHYSSFSGKEFGKAKTFGQFEVKGVTWDANCGAADLDMLLVEHFAAEFNEKHLKGKDDVLNYPRAVARLRKAAKKTKEILSANNFAPVSVEGLHDEVDFRSEIYREAFEKMAAPVFTRCAKPLADLVEQTGVDLADVEAVELLGGGTRIPGVVAALSAALGGRTPDRHMDSDESVAFGAGLHAANMSTAFRVRKFGAVDAASYALTVEFDVAATETKETPEAEGTVDEEATLPAAKRMTLLPRFKKLPVKRVVALNNITGDTRLTVSYDDAGTGLMPAGAPHAEIAGFLISGMEDVAGKYNATGKVNVHFAVDGSGVMTLSKAEAIVELPDLPDKPKKVKKTSKNATVSNTTDEDKDADAEEEEAAKGEAEEGGGGASEEAATESGKEETPAAAAVKKEKKKRTARIALEVTQTSAAVPKLTAEATSSAAARLKELKKKDDEKAATEEAKNTLEAYTISTREKLNYDEQLAAVSTESEREGLVADLMDAEDWIYGDGDGAGLHEYRAKLLGLTQKADPIFDRAKEAVERPAAVAAAKKFIDSAKSTVGAWAETKPWINETLKENLLMDVQVLETWLQEKEEEQSAVKPHEEPAFKAKVLTSKVTPLEARLAKLKKTPKPKPPKVEVVNTTDTVNATDAQTDGDAPVEEEARPLEVEEEEKLLDPPVAEDTEPQEKAVGGDDDDEEYSKEL